MQFSDTTNNLGIVQDIDFILNTDGTSYPIDDKTRNINNWFSRVVSLILNADGRWEWDDQNQADDPIYTANLVSGTQEYAISSVTFLKILKVEIKDSAGNWISVTPISLDDMRGRSMTDFNNVAGTPKYYDKLGNKLWLYPKPNYASTDGLKIYYQRNQVAFTKTDTTKVPGFAAPFHKILSLGASLDYCLSKGISNKVPLLREEIAKLELGLQEHYGDRGHDEKMRMSLRHEDYGARSAVGITNYFPNS